MFYVRRKDNPLIILGYPTSGDGTGFDPNIYEEVESQQEGLPEGWMSEHPQLSLLDQLKVIMATLPPDVQAAFGPISAAVDLACRNNEPNVAKLEIQNTPVPVDLQPIKDQLLALLP